MNRPRPSELAAPALVLGCLFVVPLLPLVGLVLGVIALGRTRSPAPRTLPLAAVAVSALSFVCLQAVPAAVAIPAWLRFLRRAKTLEASLNLRKLADGTSAYLAARRGPPPPADWTPEGRACDRPDRRFPPDEKHWRSSPWRELNFALADPHHYQYRVRVSGPESVTVEARGDLDCDGEYSLYRQRVTPNGVGPLEVELELE